MKKCFQGYFLSKWISIKFEFFKNIFQIVLTPSTLRSRDHISSIIGLDESSRSTTSRTEAIADATLKDLKRVFETAIRPLEKAYKYQDISNRHVTDAEIFGTPLLLLLGPYSTGKSSFINYLLGLEYTKRALRTGQYKRFRSKIFINFHSLQTHEVLQKIFMFENGSF